MSNEEEKKCPLCAEEMDWTDRQLKPCQCGYQVCVWCWHHIIDIAQKDEQEARCPACRTPYDKEKIVGMEANCERLVTIHSNRRHKPQKVKSKTNGRTDLTNVRVIQRKMAYVIGLPLSLADEDLLQQKEYFGQYGKVSKVSLFRAASGAIQQFVNDTCTVYITYSKEEEAVRCIQSVHGFVLEGRFLRASFGTAKYCHSWLRNMPCTNPSCLYLHNIGAEEDSFNKDEIAAIHTRNRVEQIVGGTQNMQGRSGNVLPPPPCEPLGDNGVSIEKAVVRRAEKDATNATLTSSCHLPCALASANKDGHVKSPNKTTSLVDVVGQSCSFAPSKVRNVAEDKKILNLCSELCSLTIDKDNLLVAEHPDANLCKLSSPCQFLTGQFRDKEAKGYSIESLREPSDSFALGRADLKSSDACFTEEQLCLLLDSGRQIMHGSHGDMKEDVVFFDDRGSKDSISSSHTASLLPLSTSVNSMSIDGYNRGKLQNSAGSNRFSDDEIMEQLRRLDDNLINDDDNCALDVVRSCIISNILSMDFDACDDSTILPHGVAELLDETAREYGCSQNFNNGNQSRFSFGEKNSYKNQVTDLESAFGNIYCVPKKYSVLQDSLQNKESYRGMPPNHVSAAHTPLGFSMSSRRPPPGFPACERMDQVLCATSGSHSVRNSSPCNQCFPPSLGNAVDGSDIDVIDPAILVVGSGKPTTGLDISGLDMRPLCDGQPSTYEDEARPLLLMQQSAFSPHDPKFPQVFMQENPCACQNLGFSCHMEHGLSPLCNNALRVSGNMDQRLICSPLALAQLSRQKNGTVTPISPRYLASLDDLRDANEVGMAEVKRNLRLGLNNFFPGYGDIMLQMPRSGDVYSSLYGL